MLTIGIVNPIAELGKAQEGVAEAQQDNTFAEQLLELSALGYGDPYAARQIAAVARSLMGHRLQKESFWFDVVKEEKESFKKAWELMKD